MADWQLVEFEPLHAVDIAERNMRGQESGWAMEIDLPSWAYTCKRGGPAYTLLVGGVPVCCSGVVLQEWKRGDAWALMSTLFYHHKIKTYRAMKAGLEMIISEKNLTRVQALIDSRFPQSAEYIECLGFSCEGRLRKYGPQGEDYLMFSRITPEVN